jgi:hypothetical protein
MPTSYRDGLIRHRYAACVNRFLAIPVTAVVLMAVPACDSTPRRADGSPLLTPDASEGAWLREIKSIRVHPLSRIMARTDPLMLDVRVECSDLDDNDVRTVGLLRVQVGTGEGAETVTVDLNDHTTNRRCWDSVTRTYSVRVPAPAGFQCQPKATLPVEVWLRLNADAELHATRQVACP